MRCEINSSSSSRVLICADVSMRADAQRERVSQPYGQHRVNSRTIPDRVSGADIPVCLFRGAGILPAFRAMADRNVCPTEEADRNVCPTEEADRNVCPTEEADR